MLRLCPAHGPTASALLTDSSRDVGKAQKHLPTLLGKPHPRTGRHEVWDPSLDYWKQRNFHVREAPGECPGGAEVGCASRHLPPSLSVSVSPSLSLPLPSLLLTHSHCPTARAAAGFQPLHPQEAGDPAYPVSLDSQPWFAPCLSVCPCGVPISPWCVNLVLSPLVLVSLGPALCLRL